eukprot:7089035-Prorocentrum_lima.AAC.1
MLHGNTCPCPPLTILSQDAGARPRCPVCRKMRVYLGELGRRHTGPVGDGLPFLLGHLTYLGEK